MGEIVVAISGASGAIYGKRLVEVLSELKREVRLVVTDAGRLTLMHECNNTPEELAQSPRVILEDNDDIAARSASGSAAIDAVVVCPCSGTTLGKLAAGIGDNLVKVCNSCHERAPHTNYCAKRSAICYSSFGKYG